MAAVKMFPSKKTSVWHSRTRNSQQPLGNVFTHGRIPKQQWSWALCPSWFYEGIKRLKSTSIWRIFCFSQSNDELHSPIVLSFRAEEVLSPQAWVLPLLCLEKRRSSSQHRCFRTYFRSVNNVWRSQAKKEKKYLGFTAWQSWQPCTVNTGCLYKLVMFWMQYTM